MLTDIIKTRKSVRAFLNKEVSIEQIREILEVARYSPSSTNTQPWEVCVVTGERNKALGQKIRHAFISGEKAQMDYQYYPNEFIQPIHDRKRALGRKMYGVLHVEKGHHDNNLQQLGQNYISFGAPVTFYFFLDNSLKKGSFLDCGILMQTIALTATQMGLASCMLASLAQYPHIVREELNISDNKMLICGLALGYEDNNALINSFRSDKLEVDDFAKFYD